MTVTTTPGNASTAVPMTTVDAASSTTAAPSGATVAAAGWRPIAMMIDTMVVATEFAGYDYPTTTTTTTTAAAAIA